MIIRADIPVIMAIRVSDVPDTMVTRIWGTLVWPVDTRAWDTRALVADIRALADTRVLVAVTRALVAVIRASVVIPVWPDIRADTRAWERHTQRLATDTQALVADYLVIRTIVFQALAVATRIPPQ